MPPQRFLRNLRTMRTVVTDTGQRTETLIGTLCYWIGSHGVDVAFEPDFIAFDGSNTFAVIVDVEAAMSFLSILFLKASDLQWDAGESKLVGLWLRENSYRFAEGDGTQIAIFNTAPGYSKEADNDA